MTTLWPRITFRVNLETLNRQGHVVPNRTQLTGSETVSEADDQKFRRSSWTPTNFNGNARNINLKHGEVFTLEGEQAIYMKNLYVRGNSDDLLVVTQTV